MHVSRVLAAPRGLYLGRSTRDAARAVVLCLSLLVAVVVVPAAPAGAATLPAGFSQTTVTPDLGLVTAMAFAPDGRLFVTTQGGVVRIVKNGALLPTPFLSIKVDARGERGLSGITFDPAFATNRYVYRAPRRWRRRSSASSADRQPRSAGT